MDRRQFTETPARHYIQVIPDADPQVALLEPSEDAKASLRKTVPIKYWARDDYGLADAGIIYSVNDGGELRFPLPPFQGKTADERALEWPITQVIPGLKRNDIVTFALQVSDGRPDRPGLGRSPARRVQFVSDGEYVAYVLARQRKLLGQIRPLYLQEREATAHLESLRQSAPDAGAPMTRPVSTIGEGKAP